MSDYHEWDTMKEGSHGADVTRLQQLLAGGNRWDYNAHPGGTDGHFGPATGAACERMKWFLGYPTDRITPTAAQQLRAYMVAKGFEAYRPLPDAYRDRKRRRRGTSYHAVEGTYPLANHGRIIGIPYQGTHAGPYLNWESCNAVDISASWGTPVLAVADGHVGSQIGPLSSGDPRLLGLRLHLVRADGDQEWYYAHLSRLSVRAGQRVRRGDRLGYSGSANGVLHLHFGQHHGDPGRLIGSPTPGYRDHNYPG